MSTHTIKYISKNNTALSLSLMDRVNPTSRRSKHTTQTLIYTQYTGVNRSPALDEIVCFKFLFHSYFTALRHYLPLYVYVLFLCLNVCVQCLTTACCSVWDLLINGEVSLSAPLVNALPVSTLTHTYKHTHTQAH